MRTAPLFHPRAMSGHAVQVIASWSKASAGMASYRNSLGNSAILRCTIQRTPFYVRSNAVFGLNSAETERLIRERNATTELRTLTRLTPCVVWIVVTPAAVMGSWIHLWKCVTMGIFATSMGAAVSASLNNLPPPHWSSWCPPYQPSPPFCLPTLSCPHHLPHLFLPNQRLRSSPH